MYLHPALDSSFYIRSKLQIPRDPRRHTCEPYELKRSKQTEARFYHILAGNGFFFVSFYRILKINQLFLIILSSPKHTQHY